jgi:glyoxylase-like metal-dependent hydrolase (beta-lactamase superfamily II)
MENQQWQKIDGTRQVELYAWVRKPDLASSNSYVLSTAGQLAVIDPGGSPDQSEALVSVLRARLQERPRPVFLYLTHCHVDHAMEAIRNRLWRELPGVKIVVHEDGAAALATGDRSITQAGILGIDFPAALPDSSQLASPGRGVHCETGAPPLLAVIPLGAGDCLEVYATPGHSPDGLCFRVGEVLFAGDLLAAVTPLVAGVAGWSHPDLIASLNTVAGLLETGRIHVCGPGHGNLLQGEAIAKAFQRTLAEAVQLSKIELVNPERVRFVTGYAQQLFEELAALFTLINQRIERVASRMDEFEEYAAARQIRRILDSDQVTQLLLEFRNFQAGLRRGQLIEVQVALKAIQVVPRIRRLLQNEQLQRVVDPSLLQFTCTLLADFMQAAKGLRLDQERQEHDLNGLVAALVKELSSRPGVPAALEEIPDDPAGFCEFLVSSIAYVPIFKDVVLRYDKTDDGVSALLAMPRFHDCLKRFLEDLVDWGAKAITFKVERETGKAGLAINAEFSRPVFEVGEHRLHPYHRLFPLSGAQMDVQFLPTTLNFQFSFESTG